MKEQSDIKSKIDKALESLDGLQKAEPTSFFYTRVRARLEREERNVWETTGKFLARPVVAFAGLFLILGLNAFILFEKNTSSTLPGQYTQQNGQVQEDESILTAANTFEYENLVQE